MEEKITDQQKHNKRIREIKGVICLSLALFLLLCLVSYRPQDPSFTHFVVSGKSTHNFTGKVGSYAADSLIRLLGISSFVFRSFFWHAVLNTFCGRHLLLTPKES